MSHIDVALASCVELPEPDFDELPLTTALSDAAISCRVLAWDDPRADFGAARLTVLRATWNYPLDHDRFLRWAEATASASELWNPLPIVRWNSHKRYLLDLATAGIAIAPTELVPRGSDRRLADILVSRRWTDVVVKPAVSAASHRTRLFPEHNCEPAERHLRELAAVGDVLVQRYLPSVEDYGERALVWVDGEFTHAVRKSVRFVDDDESVSPDAVAMTSSERRLGERTLAAVRKIVEAPLMYGRVDVALGPNGEPMVMELELIEPSLFFAQSPRALRRFVAAIRERLDAR